MKDEKGRVVRDRLNYANEWWKRTHEEGSTSSEVPDFMLGSSGKERRKRRKLQKKMKLNNNIEPFPYKIPHPVLI